MVGHLSQRAIGRDDPAILNYTLIYGAMSRKSCISCGFLPPEGIMGAPVVLRVPPWYKIWGAVRPPCPARVEKMTPAACRFVKKFLIFVRFCGFGAKMCPAAAVYAGGIFTEWKESRAPPIFYDFYTHGRDIYVEKIRAFMGLPCCNSTPNMLLYIIGILSHGESRGAKRNEVQRWILFPKFLRE